MLKSLEQIIPKELLDSILQKTLSNLNIVTKEDFTIQKKVLLKTREKLEELEQKVVNLEQSDK